MRRKLAICILCSPIVALAAWAVVMEVSLWQTSQRSFWIVNASLTTFVLLIFLVAWALNELDR